ncbi:hypothetical protein D6745_00850, partial [Candidatus Woesearchaeota archaeon]
IIPLVFALDLEMADLIVKGHVTYVDFVDDNETTKYYFAEIRVDEARQGRNALSDNAKQFIDKAKSDGFVTVKFSYPKKRGQANKDAVYLTGEYVEAYLTKSEESGFYSTEKDGEFFRTYGGKDGKTLLRKAPLYKRMFYSSITYSFIVLIIMLIFVKVLLFDVMKVRQKNKKGK